MTKYKKEQNSKCETCIQTWVGHGSEYVCIGERNCFVILRTIVADDSKRKI